MHRDPPLCGPVSFVRVTDEASLLRGAGTLNPVPRLADFVTVIGERITCREERNENTRRLNVGFVQGSVVLAGLIGMLLESWWAFFIALAIALCHNLWSNEIRLQRRDKT